MVHDGLQLHHVHRLFPLDSNHVHAQDHDVVVPTMVDYPLLIDDGPLIGL